MPRGLQIPGRGMRAMCYKEVGWREVVCMDVPPWGVKLPKPCVPSPAQGPQLQGQVPAKDPQLKLIPIAINREITFMTRLQGGLGRGWMASLLNKPILLTMLLQVSSHSISLPLTCVILVSCLPDGGQPSACFPTWFGFPLHF